MDFPKPEKKGKPIPPALKAREEEPPPVPPERRNTKKTFAKALIDDLQDAYYDLGGKDFVVKHTKSHPNYKQKFIDNIAKLAAKAIESDVRINVSGRVEHDHIAQYGFTPEIVIGAINKMQAEHGVFQLDTILALPVPPNDPDPGAPIERDLVPVEKVDIEK